MPETQSYLGVSVLERPFGAHLSKPKDHSRRRNLLPRPGATKAGKVPGFYIFLFSLNQHSKAQRATLELDAAVPQTSASCEVAHGLPPSSENLIAGPLHTKREFLHQISTLMSPNSQQFSLSKPARTKACSNVLSNFLNCSESLWTF